MQPSANGRPTAAGKRPVQARSLALSTPSNPKRGRGAAGSRGPTQQAGRQPKDVTA